MPTGIVREPHLRPRRRAGRHRALRALVGASLARQPGAAAGGSRPIGIRLQPRAGGLVAAVSPRKAEGRDHDAGDRVAEADRAALVAVADQPWRDHEPQAGAAR